MSSQDVRRLAESAGSQPDATDEDGPLDRLDADMAHVLRVFEAMGGRLLEESTVPEARAQPTLDAAVRRLAGETSDDGVMMELGLIPSQTGDIRSRIYTPAAAMPDAGYPMILYLHDGCFVTGDMEQIDASAHQLSRRCGAIVVAIQYRQAPEARFPAAHLDALTAWKWLVETAESVGGDSRHIAIVGEGSGGNLAISTALKLRDDNELQPVHLGLVTPMAAMTTELPSHLEIAGGVPFSTATLSWATRKLFRKSEEARDVRMNPAGRGDLAGLPPVTLILASADPLRSEGAALGNALQGAGVTVDQTLYEGVTHGFFGLYRVVNKAMFAHSQLATNLRAAFNR